MRVLLKGSVVSIDEKPLGPQRNASAMVAFVGPAVSSREIPMHPAGVRKANVSSSGIVWYVDHPEDRVSHLHFALSPGDTPEHPPFSFGGSIRLNSVELTTEVSEAEFPPDGEVLLRGRHHNWFYETPDHHVSFVFKRRRNRVGKRSGAYRLAIVSVSFKSNSEPASAETNRTSPGGCPSR
jgi:hypothetical protein